MSQILKKYAIRTYGCKLNQAESGGLREALSQKFQEVSEEEADFIIINSCGVIKQTERKILRKIESFKGKKVIMTGCLPAINQDVKNKVDIAISGNNPNDLFQKISDFTVPNLLPVSQKKNSCSMIIPVATGCLGNCSYCSSKLARGQLKSYPKDQIIAKIKKERPKEIQLTSQDLSVYGMESGKSNLVDLLTNILKLDYDFRMKLGMMNPAFVKDYLVDLLDLFESKKLYNFLHIPVQSGDDQVLQMMNRDYSVADYLQMINMIKKKGNFLISTDIIVGFPGETEQAFRRTLDLIKETRPHIINITRYSPRPGTNADRLKDMPSKIKKERSRTLNSLAKSIRMEDNKKMVGSKLSGLIFEKKKCNNLARVFNGKAVVLQEGQVGDFVKIKIIDFKHNYLIGKID